MPIHPEHKKSLVRKIVAITQEITSFNTPPKRHRRYLIHEGVGFALVDEGAEKYDSITREFLEKLKWSEKYTESNTEKKLRELVSKAIEGKGNTFLENMLQKMVDEYDSINQLASVFLPIDGISIMKDLEFGEFTFRKNSPELKERITRMFAKAVEKTSNTKKAKKIFKTDVSKKLEQMFEHQVIAEFKVIAEASRAQEIALRKMRRTLDIIRTSIPLLYSSNFKIEVGIGGEVPPSSFITFSVSNQSANINETLLSPDRAYELDKKSMKKMEDCGLLIALELFKMQDKDTVNPIQESYLQAIHWLANAQSQRERENKFLSLVTCLETFLAPEKDSGLPITNTVAESYVFLIFSGSDLKSASKKSKETPYELRKRVKKRIKELYDIRSKITHGGKVYLTEKDMNDLTVAAYTIMRHIFNNLSVYTSLVDVRRRVEELMLS
jgi:Apea-like HEPN